MKSAPQIQPARPGVLATAQPAPPRRPSLVSVPSPEQELQAFGKALQSEPSLRAAALRVQKDLLRLVRLDEVALVWIDWPRRIASTIAGPVETPLEELAFQVAGSGKRYAFSDTLVEPIGRTPARAVLLARKPPGPKLSRDEAQLLGAVAIGIAPAIDRLIGLSIEIRR